MQHLSPVSPSGSSELRFFFIVYRKDSNGILYEVDVIETADRAAALTGARHASRYNAGALALSESCDPARPRRLIIKTFGAVWG